jgi:SAM-dependent methyltransferase
VFDRIAWIYGFLYPMQRLAFRRNMQVFLHRLALPGRARILEIGCGTGAWVSVLAEMGYEVRAVDASPRMVATARRLLRQERLTNQEVQVAVGNPLQGLDYPDQDFDLVLAAHVLHGMPPAQRRQFYREARRVARGPVLFYDYAPGSSQGTRFVTRMLETLERSDYRRFRLSVVRELRELFTEVEVIANSADSAWYLCRSRP